MASTVPLKMLGGRDPFGPATGNAIDSHLVTIRIEVDGEAKWVSVDRLSGYRLYAVLADKLGVPVTRIESLAAVPPV